MKPLVSVTDLHVTYRRPGHRRSPVRAVAGIDLEVERGETVALVGESGAGKTTVARCLVGLVRADRGTVRIGDFDVTGFGRRPPTAFRQLVQAVFQRAGSSLNPALTVAATIDEPLALHLGLDAADRRRRTAELLHEVGLGDRHLGRRRHELSAGELQRVGIARALATNPIFIVLDEPVSALDASTRAGVLETLERVRLDRGVTYLLITHDLDVAMRMSGRIVVMHSGSVVDAASTTEIARSARHPYTHRLLDALLRVDRAGPA